jgi:hypothetical protein
MRRREFITLLAVFGAPYKTPPSLKNAPTAVCRPAFRLWIWPQKGAFPSQCDLGFF